MLLLILGVITYIVGLISLTIDEFKENILFGILGLLTLIFHIVFAIMFFDRCKRSLLIILIGLVLMLFGGVILANNPPAPY